MKTVLCPRCSELCSLLPMARPGSYRLANEDGLSHAAGCIGMERRPAPVRYHPRGAQRFAALKAGAA